MLRKKPCGKIETLLFGKVDIQIQPIAKPYHHTIFLLSFGMVIHPVKGLPKSNSEINTGPITRIFYVGGGHPWIVVLCLCTVFVFVCIYILILRIENHHTCAHHNGQ